MNKRKSDNEFAEINLSYISPDGKEVVVFCPESKSAPATQDPIRRDIHSDESSDQAAKELSRPEVTPSAIEVMAEVAELPADEIVIEELKEQHYTIHYGATGYSYESIVGPYLDGAKFIEIEDPYIRLTHQIHNFVRFCEAAVKTPTIRKIRLVTSYDGDTDVKKISESLSELKQSLLELDVELELKINEHMHDREIRIDNGWTVKIGRGLDFFQKPDSWFGVGANDLSQRRCLETKVDIYRR